MQITRRSVPGALAAGSVTHPLRAADPLLLDRVELTAVCDGTAGQFGIALRLPGFRVDPTPRPAGLSRGVSRRMVLLAACARGRTAGSTFGAIDGGRRRAPRRPLRRVDGAATGRGHRHDHRADPARLARAPAGAERDAPRRRLPPPGVSPDKQTADLVVDDAAHEPGVVFNIRDRGLVVIGSCSHRGIVNTVQRAQAVTGERRILAIVGGFHLVPPQTPAQAIETVELMRTLAPAYVVPGHCTGETFLAAAQAASPNRVSRAPVGTRLTFGT